MERIILPLHLASMSLMLGTEGRCVEQGKRPHTQEAHNDTWCVTRQRTPGVGSSANHSHSLHQQCFHTTRGAICVCFVASR